MASSTTTEAALEQAAQLVESKQQSDAKFPEISELLHASSSCEYEAGIPPDWQVVRKQRAVGLPDALFEQYDLLECRCFMGLFPEIGRAWITVDHRLFLWNYEDEEDFYTFEGQEQVIVSVGLVRPQRGVFVDDVKHVLVVATPLEVFLLGVGYRAGPRGGDVTLYATQISVAADGVAMTSIAGTADGRILMAGNDGALYELQYRAADGWLSRRARKVNLTAGVLSYFVPTFLSAAARGTVTAAVSVVVDDVRRLAYVLQQDAAIRVFWLGADGSAFEHVMTHRSVGAAAALLCPQFEGAGVELISLHVIPVNESRSLALVAVTSGGARIYFSTVGRAQRLHSTVVAAAASKTTVSEKPAVFDVVHVRLAPGSPGTRVHAAYCGGSTTLLARAAGEDHDAIVGAAPASAQILARAARQPRASLVELAAEARVEGRTWALAEIGGQTMRNDLATVDVVPQRRFAALTNAGVTVLEQQRPLDMLRALLSQPTVRDAELRAFVSTYGLDEACAMCYALLCADDTQPMRVDAAARRLLFEHGGIPRAAEAPAFAPTSGTEQSGGRVELSGRHNGLVMYLARVLQPVWTQSALAADGAQLRVVLNMQVLAGVQRRLQRLQRFVASDQRFVPDQLGSFAATAAQTADSARCWQAEAASLAALYDLLVRAIEVASFADLLCELNLPAASAAMPPDQRQQLAGATFARLVCSSGRSVCRDLALALVHAQPVGSSALSDVLGARCAGMFSAADVALCRALEHLRAAAEADEDAAAATLARDALELLAGIAASLSIQQLRDACAAFEKLNRLSCVWTLALACATQSDPRDTAVAFWGDGAPAGDEREALYRRRMDCYSVVLDMLDRRWPVDIHVLQQLPREDALFQFALFDWLLARDQSSMLFRMHAPLVEQYLLIEPRTLEKGDMLWHFYVQSSQYYNAALVLQQLACASDLDLMLTKRIEYLSLAITNAKTSVGSASAGAVPADELGLMVRETEDLLDVAQVQLMIQQQLEQQQNNEAARDLDRRIYTVTELYDRFAEPLRLWDAMLLIFKASNHDDAQMVEDVWQVLLRSVLDDQQSTGLLAVSSKVSQLGSRLYPSASAFPLVVVARILVDLSLERAAEYSRGLIFNTFVQAQVPHGAIFDALNKLYSQRASSSQGCSEFAALVAREVSLLAADWIDSQASSEQPRGLCDEKLADSLPVMDVDTALSQYIINATLSNNQELKSALQHVQDRLRQIF
ncbi:Nup133 N terminal like-domain-containing protein [Coemansia mojavensis]|nr:Nup133 N terminal like-domain-containing protein [Coemansia mojavensis]